MLFTVVLLLLLPCVLTTAANAQQGGRSFIVDYEQQVFLKDGVPHQIISGSFHYFRVTPGQWKERLQLLKRAGLNAVQTYIPWNLHQPERNVLKFDGDVDFQRFFKLAKEVGLDVVVRAGPYICGEHDFGGFPYWLLQYPNISLRTSKDAAYMSNVMSWMGTLLPKLKPLLHENGGNVLMVQLENEYGSFGDDKVYLEILRDQARKILGPTVVLYSTDGGAESLLNRTLIDGVFQTIDFGPGTNVADMIAVKRKFQKGPVMNSEFYPGWLCHWGDTQFPVAQPDLASGTLKAMLEAGMSVNVYMFHGGTNFGFLNGANGYGSDYQPSITSYDYSAPLDESGNPTAVYIAFQQTIFEYLQKPVPSIPGSHTMMAMQPKTVTEKIDLFSVLPQPVSSDNRIRSMEDLNQAFGFVLYRTSVLATQGSHLLSVFGVSDRALVFVDGARAGIVSRTNPSSSNLTIHVESEKQILLDIFVENMGRINYGSGLVDPKGVLGNVLLDGKALTSTSIWKTYSFPLSDLDFVRKSFKPCQTSCAEIKNTPTFFRAAFEFQGDAVDTLLRFNGTKGVAFLNGFNLGRYWPVEGPQKRLYVPRTVFKQGMNEVILFELEEATTDQVEFISGPLPWTN